jgi:hypothetical protein
MLEFFQIAADGIQLLPRDGQDVDVAGVAVAGDSALDANDQRPLGFTTVVAITGQPLQVVANHAFAQASTLADLALAGEGDAVIGGATGKPQEHQLASGLQVEVPRPALNLVTHGWTHPGRRGPP